MTRGIRNHNPGNIRKTDINWKGEVPGGDETFEVFESAIYGIRALAKLLITYDKKYGLNTVEKIINRWAPPIENDTGEYVRFMEKKTGFPKTQVLDMRCPSVLMFLCRAIIHFENGGDPYSHEVFYGVRMALDS
jgi:hypothetical protein